MATSDPLGDMLTRIRNGQSARLGTVIAPASKMRASVLEVLKAQGFIRGYKAATSQSGHPQFDIELKYFDGQPVIKEIKRVSKPGRRVYSSAKELSYVHNGLGLSIVSTPSGVMTDHEARSANVGGEVLCEVF